MSRTLDDHHRAVSALLLHHRRRAMHRELRLCAALEGLPPPFELSSPSGANGGIRAEMLRTLASFIEQLTAITRKLAAPPVLVRHEVEQLLDRRLGRLLVPVSYTHLRAHETR